MKNNIFFIYNLYGCKFPPPWQRLGDLYFRKSTGNTFFGNGNNWYVFADLSRFHNDMSGTEPHHMVTLSFPKRSNPYNEERLNLSDEKIIDLCKQNVGTAFMINEPALL